MAIMNPDPYQNIHVRCNAHNTVLKIHPYRGISPTGAVMIAVSPCPICMETQLRIGRMENPANGDWLPGI